MGKCNSSNEKERQEPAWNEFDQSMHAHEVSRSNETKLSDQVVSIWMMVLSCLLFALMGAFVKLASAHYSIGELVFYRSLIGLILMLGAARVQRGSLLTKYPKEHLLRSLCGAVALSLWFYSIGKLPLAMAMTLNYTAPIWMVLFVIISAQLKGYRKVSPFMPIAVTVGFGGVICILQPTLQDNQWWGGSVGLLSGIVSAIAFLQVAALGKLGEPGYRVVFYFSLVGMIIGVATVMLEGGFTSHTFKSILMLLAMGVLAAGAQWSLTYAFSNGKTLVNASLQYLTIAFSSVLGGLIFGDQITLMGIYGMILVVVSGVMAAYFRSKTSCYDPDARNTPHGFTRSLQHPIDK
ncbi:DMT family transporter [Pararobbsia alpina]|uniref:EamA domain-containing protein n=1 Tax=Pararobbsia alpina TaxID=621374 RepID=A0A6S7CD02_9BURK|nr:DMT family transporter [Pararobbsia alpina]CAB3786647.1 hypothetical protein LMG28138_02266 [Pararobbsia alpina]